MAMQEVSNWFIFCLVGAVFALIIMPATASVGFGLFLINAIALACCAAPIVAGISDDTDRAADGGQMEA